MTARVTQIATLRDHASRRGVEQQAALRGEFGKRQERERIRRRYRYLIAARDAFAEGVRIFVVVVRNGWTWAIVSAVFALWSNLR